MKKIILWFILFFSLFNFSYSYNNSFDYYYTDYWNRVELIQQSNEYNQRMYNYTRDIQELEYELQKVQETNRLKQLEREKKAQNEKRFNELESLIKKYKTQQSKKQIATKHIDNNGFNYVNYFQNLWDTEYKEKSYKKAIDNYKIAYSFLNNSKDESKKAILSFKLYITYRELSKYHNSNKEYTKAIETIEKWELWLAVKVENETFKINHYKWVFNYYLWLEKKR